MQYLSNHLTDFNEICMAMNFSLSNPIGNPKFENLKILKILDCGQQPS